MNKRAWLFSVFAAAAAFASAEDFPLSIATADYPHMRAIQNGKIKIPECQISYSTVALKEIEQRVETGSAGDVIEVDFLYYLKAYAQGRGNNFVMVPVFLRREFPHRYVFVDPLAKSTATLAGERALLNKPSPTLGLWARGILEDSPALAERKLLWDDSMPASKSAKPLFPEARIPEQEYFKATRIFPIVTVLAVRTELVKANPWLPEALFIAFSDAKELALEDGSMPTPWGLEHKEETIALMNRDYWSYGVKNNPKTLKALFQYAHRYGITAEELAAEDVFAPETLQLIDEKGAKN